MPPDVTWHDGPPRWCEVAGLVYVDVGAGPVLPVLPGRDLELMGSRVRERWGSLVAAHAARTGLPASWIGGFIWAESGGNPSAVSPAGAVGLMQLMPAFYGGNAGNRLADPDRNVSLGCDTIAGYRAKGCLLPAIASMYNAGPSAAFWKGHGCAKGSSRAGAKGSEYGFAQDPGYIDRVVRASNSWARAWPGEGPREPGEGPSQIPLWAIGLGARLLGWLTLPFLVGGFSP